MKFEDFNFKEDLHKSIHELGFKFPTQIQEKSIPLILQGKDIIGESATGSGKTLAFGAGVIESVNHGEGLQALILTPTRELAEQVKDVLVQIGKRLNIIAVYGGLAINPQIDSLKNADVVIATPGRFKDHLQRRTVNTTNIRVLVLDEADRMLDMGFIDDIEEIIRACPKEKQTMLFSATIPSQIQRLSNRYLKNPVKVSANKLVDPNKLKQVYYNVERNAKFSLLLHLLKSEKSELAMVFCNTRKSADVIAKNLRFNKIRAVGLHGGFSQNKRTSAVNAFKQGREKVLVCTDVAARGIDIDNISHIYNYEIPKDPTDYVHRIGRTARAGEAGKVINLLCDYDHDNFSRVLHEHRSFTIEKVKTPKVDRASLNRDTENMPRRNNFRRNGRRPERNNHRRYNS